MNRSKKLSKMQWIRCSIVMVLYLLFLLWVKSWLGLIVVPFIFDAYITKKIPWTWWKKLTNPTARTVMSWVDAIIFAIVAVYFVNIYAFQNYAIPSSSLEKSLLTGDYLFVSKLSYGPRIPQTPLSMPLTQHTLPIVNTKSYIEWPQWKYRRVKGLGEVISLCSTIRRATRLWRIRLIKLPTSMGCVTNWPNPCIPINRRWIA
jgi:signal peptidase I